MKCGGANGIRTRDPHTASVVRYQLRHSPMLPQQRSLGYITCGLCDKSAGQNEKSSLGELSFLLGCGGDPVLDVCGDLSAVDKDTRRRH